MAILRKNLLSGLIGPLVFSVVKNQQRVRKNVPKGKIKQTKGTKKAAGTFGMASSFGKQLRLIYQSEIQSLHDPGMAFRMTNTLNHILIPCKDPDKKIFTFKPDSFIDLKGFDFNLNSPLQRSLIALPIIKQTGALLSLEFAGGKVSDILLFPPNAFTCEITVSLSFFRLSRGLKSTQTHYQNLNIKQRQAEFDQVQLDFELPAGCLCIVSLFLKYYSPLKNLTVMLNDKKFSPAGIIAAFITPGTFQNRSGYDWTSMNGLKFPES